VSTPALTVIGLDAATFEVIDPLLERGELPSIAGLLETGVGGTLRSTTHPLTPHAWATMTTGVNAGRHGIWDFTERDESGYQVRVVNGSYRRAPAIWDRLTAAGRRSGLINIPFTWPAPAVNGFSLAGLDAAGREGGMAHPGTLLREIQQRFGALELDHRFPLDRGGEFDLDRVRRASEQKVELALWLTERFDPELLFTVFMSADHVHHLAWPDWEANGSASLVAEVYRILDRSVGTLLDGLGTGGDVLVVSDHGGGSLEGVVNLNAWLAQEGYLTFTGGGAQLGRQARDKAFELRRYIPEGLRHAVKQRLPGVRERIYRRQQYRPIEWSETRAFAYGTFGSIVVNLRGRESEGIVEPGEEYERVRDEVAAKALELRSPEGERIVAAVHRREDLFQGPEIERLPDLVVEFDRYAWLGKGNLKSREATLWDRIEIQPGSKHSYVGSHRHEGIVVLAGPSVAAGPRLSASIEDVAPTALYLLGEKIPADLEGRLLAEAIDPAVLDRRPVEYDDETRVAVGPETPYAADDSAVEERLRSLGYLE